ncbi:MAG: hypothetical protein G8345_09195 [Magnetococcales bacterium]|nr:hypothetical protein [Magnetococcales bacterium]NGZ27051.1 hypothetical protein [Magnetococcales bacterium]
MNTENKPSLVQGQENKEAKSTPPTGQEQPFTVRFGRLLAGKGLDDPILDPANPNLIQSRKDDG